MSAQRQSRRKLLLLATMFLAPFVAAVILYFYAPSLIPEGRVNYGTLVSPARALPALQLIDAAGAPAPKALQGKWSLLYLGGASCDEACQTRLLLVRQVRLALAQDRRRVERVYLAPSTEALAAANTLLGPGHRDLVFLSEAEGKAATFFQPADTNAIYLLDPLGNWLMVYTGVIEPKGLLKDLKKLLRYSQVG